MLIIKVLLENTQARPDALTEHGLSLYIETERHKILFDTGQTDLFAQNARTLGVDLSKADIAVISHGHYDHGGGLGRFIEINKSAPIYISCHAFEPYYSAAQSYIGLDKTLAGSTRFISVTDHTQIDDELELFTCNSLPRPYQTDSDGLNALRGSELIPDDFRHEQYLLIHDGQRRVLVSGCSHKGVLNIMEWFHPDVLIGGFHFMRLNPNGEGKKRLAAAAEKLSSYPTTFYTCHCTGVEQYSFMKNLMGEKLHYLASGQEIVL